MDTVAADIVLTGLWEEVPLDLVCTYWEDYLQPPLRAFKRKDGTFCIKLCHEEAAHLLVDPSADAADKDQPFLLQALCCEARNSVLLESDFKPSPEFATRIPRLLTYPDIIFLPHIRCQSASRDPQTKVYIPTIPRYMDALLAQIRWLEENVGSPRSVYRPMSDIRLLIRYLV